MLLYYFVSLGRIPKALSDKAFADIKAKEAAAAAKRTQMKVMNQKGKKRKANGDEESSRSPRLTSKQRRAMDRAQKMKKVGVRYYDTHDVKNKNKRTPSNTEGQKAKRSNH